MKKTYISPSMEVIKIAQSLPIALSDPQVLINSSVSVDAKDVDVKGSTPSYNVWDDDWSN